MRVSCPACAAQYDVPDAAIGAGRELRCARCGDAWYVAPPPAARPTPVADAIAARFSFPPEDLPPLPPEGDPAWNLPPPRPAVAAAVVEKPADAPGGGLLRAWGLTLVVLLAAAGGAYTYRAELVDRWPPAERVFVALGIDVGGDQPASPRSTSPAR